MATDTDSRFLLASAVVTLVGCLVATATPLVAGASAAFTGSLVTSGLLGTVFAARHLQLFRREKVVSLPPATTTLVFGVWFMLAPLVYDVGFLSTAGTQLAGLLVSAFVFYAVVAGATQGVE